MDQPTTVVKPPEYKYYRRTQIAEMADWEPGFDMRNVSISGADAANGSPKIGDKIARNPANHDDRWLVSAEYAAANFEPAMPQCNVIDVPPGKSGLIGRGQCILPFKHDGEHRFEKDVLYRETVIPKREDS